MQCTFAAGLWLCTAYLEQVGIRRTADHCTLLSRRNSHLMHGVIARCVSAAPELQRLFRHAMYVKRPRAFELSLWYEPGPA